MRMIGGLKGLDVGDSIGHRGGSGKGNDQCIFVSGRNQHVRIVKGNPLDSRWFVPIVKVVFQLIIWILVVVVVVVSMLGTVAIVAILLLLLPLLSTHLLFLFFR